VQVLHRVRPSQLPRPRVMQGAWGLRLREAPRRRSAPRNSTRFAAQYPACGLPCEPFKLSLADVETSFVRNLGGLIGVRLGMPDRLMKAKAER